MKTRTLLITVFAGALILSLSGLYLWRRDLPTAWEENEGQALGAAAESLSKILPTDIPLYPGATLGSQSQTRESIQITWEAGNNLAVIKKYYQEKLKQNGWLEREVGVFNKDRRQLELSFVEAEPQKTIIILNYIP